MKNETGTTVQSLERALILVDRLSEHSDGCPIKKLCELTGLHKSTIHRLLHTLAEYDYVYQNEETGRYHLGYKPLALSSALLENMDVRSVARPLLEELCATTEETAHLLIRSEAFAVYVDKVENPKRVITMYSQIGKRIPLYCSAAGKAMLAWLTEEKISGIIGEEPFKRYTRNTIGDMPSLMNELRSVRDQGYAIDWFEHEESIFCIASPVFDMTNQVVAAVSIAGTLLEISNTTHFMDYTKHVYQTAQILSTRLGCKKYPRAFRLPDEAQLHR